MLAFSKYGYLADDNRSIILGQQSVQAFVSDRGSSMELAWTDKREL